MSEAALAQFAADYAEHRAAEGRGYAGDALLSLPYLRQGPFAAQWAVRARSFEAFMARVVRPFAATHGALTMLDLGAGNGWLSYRATLEGHHAIALDIRDDAVDGLGAAAPFVARAPGGIDRITASFDAIPLGAASVDVAVFNAALHYATDLPATLAEAARVTRPGGRVVILDSPFYSRERDGLAMVAEKRAQAGDRFGTRADTLLALPFVEFLTPERLAAASDLAWRRIRVRYPLAHELRPFRAAIARTRRPSRFDLWVAERP
ncbi:MAG: class I SAM-dependent methyltransferase [Sphingomonas sp.]|uniref:class I SAM-dependent methyltransferase n=1 Tax=Sphingomonas sp. TaxID=28214 RepID=UPI003F8201EB